MYQLTLMPIARLSSTASLRTIQNASSAVFHTLSDRHGSTQLNLNPHHSQAMSTKPSIKKSILFDINPDDAFFSKVKAQIKFHTHWKYIYRGKAMLLYRHTFDSFDHVAFMEDFQLADTYYSWFLVTELHIWMLLVKLATAGLAGREVGKNLLIAMWQDADARRQQLGHMSKSVVAPQMQMIGYQFNAAIVGYDEGLLGNDQVLAGAIWRRFFLSECNNPEYVEKLVAYIRKNIHMLDNTSVEDVIRKAKVTFIPCDQC